MNMLELPAIDAVRVKKMARSVQRRHRELGTTVSLNHAYEAVAAVFGFETWSRMKASLDNSAVTPSATPADGAEDRLGVSLKNSRVQFEDFVPSDLCPFTVVYGPDRSVSKHVAGQLLNRWIDRSETNSTIWIVTENVGQGFARWMLDQSSIFGSGERPFVFTATKGEPGQHINPFDLPLGRRTPNRQHRERLIDFLCTLFQNPEGNKYSFRALSGHLVDKAYDKVSDTTHSGQPQLYRMGILPEVDAEYKHGLIGETWWSVASALDRDGKAVLARKAQAMAVPQLSQLMGILRSEIDLSSFSHPLRAEYEAMIEIAIKAISSTVREVRYLQGPTSLPLTRLSGPIIIEFGDVQVSNFVHAILPHIVEDLVRFATDKSAPRLIVVDDLSPENAAGFLNNPLNLRLAEKDVSVYYLAIAHRQQQYRSLPPATAVVLHGAETRKTMDHLWTFLRFSDQAHEDFHNYVYEKPGQYALGVKRGLGTVVDGLIRLP